MDEGEVARTVKVRGDSPVRGEDAGEPRPTLLVETLLLEDHDQPPRNLLLKCTSTLDGSKQYLFVSISQH